MESHAPLMLQHFKEDLALQRPAATLAWVSFWLCPVEWMICESVWGKWVVNMCCLDHLVTSFTSSVVPLYTLARFCWDILSYHPTLDLRKEGYIVFCLVVFALSITCFHGADIVLSLVESWEVYLQSFQGTQVPEKQHKMNSSWSLREDDGTSLFPHLV